MNAREAIDDRHVNFVHIYRLRKQKVSAAFNTFVLYRNISLASKDLQRVYRGYKGRMYALRCKYRELELDKIRNEKELSYVDATAAKVEELLAPLKDYKIRKLLLLKCATKVDARYKLETTCYHQRIFSAHQGSFSIGLDRLDFLGKGYIAGKDMDNFWFSIKNVPLSTEESENTNIRLAKLVKISEEQGEKQRLMQEKKLEKANLMRAKRKSIMLGKDDSLQVSDDTIDAPNDDNQSSHSEAGEHLPNLSKGQEENSEDQELVNFIRSTAWSNYEIPTSVLMKMAQEEQLHKDMKASFIQKILHKYKSKATDSPVFIDGRCH